MRDSKHRRTQKQFLIDGLKSIELAAKEGVQVRELFVNEESAGSDAVAEQLSEYVREIYFVSATLMNKLNYGEQTHSCVAVADFFETSIQSLSTRINERLQRQRERSDLFLVVDRIEKPGNLGAILRTADAAGVDAVLLSDSICDVFNPNAIRSSLGAVFTLPIASGTSESVLEWLKSNHVAVYTARVEGSEDYTVASYITPHSERAALVVGNEALGLGSRWSESCFQAVRIPMRGLVDSLNASVSTAVILFEMVRQKQSAVSRTSSCESRVVSPVAQT